MSDDDDDVILSMKQFLHKSRLADSFAAVNVFYRIVDFICINALPPHDSLDWVQEWRNLPHSKCLVAQFLRGNPARIHRVPDSKTPKKNPNAPALTDFTVIHLLEVEQALAVLKAHWSELLHEYKATLSWTSQYLANTPKAIQNAFVITNLRKVKDSLPLHRPLGSHNPTVHENGAQVCDVYDKSYMDKFAGDMIAAVLLIVDRGTWARSTQITTRLGSSALALVSIDDMGAVQLQNQLLCWRSNYSGRQFTKFDKFVDFALRTQAINPSRPRVLDSDVAEIAGTIDDRSPESGPGGGLLGIDVQNAR
ncbi:hypothetical protein BDR05DRAFT_991503 [Suillus weaverae]|nr:hypothetical protein BDR05DRAFT_991503 [Suillus weaverae]